MGGYRLFEREQEGVVWERGRAVHDELGPAGERRPTENGRGRRRSQSRSSVLGCGVCNPHKENPNSNAIRFCCVAAPANADTAFVRINFVVGGVGGDAIIETILGAVLLMTSDVVALVAGKLYIRVSAVIMDIAGVVAMEGAYHTGDKSEQTKGELLGGQNIMH